MFSFFFLRIARIFLNSESQVFVIPVYIDRNIFRLPNQYDPRHPGTSITQSHRLPVYQQTDLRQPALNTENLELDLSGACCELLFDRKLINLV